MRRISSIAGATLAVIVVLFVALGCASGGASTSRPAASAAPARPGSGSQADDKGGLTGDVANGDGDQAPGQVVSGPLIVHTGSMSLEVTDLRAAIDQATAVVTGLGGNVAESHEDNSGGDESARVTYRIPAPNWTDALTALRAVGQKVVAEDTDAADVTTQVVDLDARIANLRSSEAALQQIMTQATTIPDVLNVQRELSSVRGEIESMTAQRDQLADQAALSTLTVNFNVPIPRIAVAAGGWDLGREIDGAVATLVRFGQGLASLGVWLLIVVVPVVVPLLILIWVGLRGWRRFGPRSEEPSTPTI